MGTLGCGTYWDWANHRSSGQWTGANAIAKLITYDGSGAILYADSLHFWPYGWNYDNERPGGPQHWHRLLASPDMGLSSGTRSNPIASSTFKVINRNSNKALEVKGQYTTNGAAVDQWGYNGGNNQRWSFAQQGNGIYKIVGIQSGKALEVKAGSTPMARQWTSGLERREQPEMVRATCGQQWLLQADQCE